MDTSGRATNTGGPICSTSITSIQIPSVVRYVPVNLGSKTSLTYSKREQEEGCQLFPSDINPLMHNVYKVVTLLEKENHVIICVFVANISTYV